MVPSASGVSVGATRTGSSSGQGEGAPAGTGVPGEVRVGGGRKPGGVADIAGSDVTPGVGSKVGSKVGPEVAPRVAVGDDVCVISENGVPVSDAVGSSVGVTSSDSKGIGD